MRKKLNILYISEYFPPYVLGGAEVSTSLITKGISKYHRCYVLTNNFQKKSWNYNGGKVYPLLKNTKVEEKSIFGSIKYFFNYKRRLRKNYKVILDIINRKNINLIHIIPTGVYSMNFVNYILKLDIPCIIDNRDGTLACPIAFKNKCTRFNKKNLNCIKCVSKNYSVNFGALNFLKSLFALYEVNRFFNMKKRIVKKINKKNNSLLVFNSAFVRDQLIKEDYPKDKTCIIPSMLQRTLKGNSLRENKIVFAGRIEKEKGIWDAINALKLVDDKNLVLEIAGGGSEVENIQNYIKKENIKNINILGRIPNDKVLMLYSTSKAIIAPSIWPEPFGRFILESIASKTPLISTKTGGTPEGIKDHETGLLVEPNNPKQLAKAIKELLTDKTLYYKIVENLNKEVPKYNPENIVKKRLKIYEELVNKT